ncbi:hypothetical protein V6Z11_A02G153900 [Gossypium hirsutum]
MVWNQSKEEKDLKAREKELKAKEAKLKKREWLICCSLFTLE